MAINSVSGLYGYSYIYDFRIVWTSPNLPYNSSYYRTLSVTTDSGITGSFSGESQYGTHSDQYALKYHDSITFSAYAEGYKSSTRRSRDTSTYNFYHYWANVDAQITFYDGDYSSDSASLDSAPTITSYTNDNETTSPITKPITAVARIDGEIVARDCITLNIMPDDTDYGVFIQYSYFDSSDNVTKTFDSSATGGIVVLPENGLYSKTVKVYCPPYNASPKGGNTISAGSILFDGDNFIYDNCEISAVDASYKSCNIVLNLDQTNGIIYKDYTGTFTITGASNPSYSNKFDVQFLADENAELFDLNVPDEFVLTLGQEVEIQATLNTIEGLEFRVSVDSSLQPYINAEKSNYSEGLITVVHTARQIVNDITGTITISVVEVDTSTNTTTTYGSKTINVTLDKIWMPDSITVVINQIAKRIYFTIEEYDESTGTYINPHHLGEDSSLGTSFELPYEYPAQGDNIESFTKKFRLTCYGSDWRVLTNELPNWIGTTLDEGDDYHTAHAQYNFAVWTSPNPYIWKRTGKITVVSEKLNGSGQPRAKIEINVKQSGAVYAPDFSVSIVPKLETDSSIDASINSAFTEVPVYGKAYMVKITNNCAYDVLHIDDVSIEGTKVHGDDYITGTYPKYPDMDPSINISSVNPPVLTNDSSTIIVPEIYGQSYKDSSSGAGASSLPGPTVRAIYVPVTGLGYIDSSVEVLDKYMSIRITAHNESHAENQSSVQVVANTDPRHLHQVGRLRSAAYEGYDEDPKNIDQNPEDRLQAFINRNSLDSSIFVGDNPTHKAYSIRTGIEILPTEDGETNDVENTDDPIWNIKQVLDERCIVVPIDMLDDYLKSKRTRS